MTNNQPQPASHLDTTETPNTRSTLQPKLVRHGFEIAKAVQQKQLKLAMSELMGCDYIFVDPLNSRELFTPKQLAVSIQELIDILEVKPLQTVIVQINHQTSPRFTRLDFTWSTGTVEQVKARPITAPDQIEFMEMMLDCSTPY